MVLFFVFYKLSRLNLKECDLLYNEYSLQLNTLKNYSMNREHKPETIAKESRLEQQALEKLKSGQYKDAIGLYKQLIKEADNEKLRLKVSAVLEKAKEFNVGDKYKALFVSDEEIQNQEEPPFFDKVETESENVDDQLLELIQSGSFDQIPAILSQLSIHDLDKQYPELATVLGVLMLTTHSEFKHDLPQDSAFIKHFNLVQIVLQAYKDNHQEKLSEALKSIPFRSAFKDFRIVLNAVLVESTSVEKRQSLLYSVSEQSPYFPLAHLLLASNKNGAELVKDLLSFNYSQQILVEEIKNFNDQQIEFIAHLLRQYDDLSEKSAFSMAIQYQTLFGSELAEQFCQIRLANYPAGHKNYIKHFGSVNEFEELRIKALSCEQDDNFYDAEYYWRQCIGQLNREEEGSDLKISLILHHLADQQQGVAAQIDYLTESLQYTPDDRETYLQVLNYYANEQQASYQYWLSQALERFPQELDFLILALRVANKHKDIAQANQFAQDILQIDSQNSVAKQTLFSAHLSQTKQFIVEKKYVEAEQQLVEIDQLNLAKYFTSHSQLMRGFLAFVSDGSKDQTDITNALQKLYVDPVNGRFKASMEALSLGLLETDISISIDQTYLSPEELSQLIEQVENYANETSYRTYLRTALDQIKPVLLKSLQQPVDDEVLWLHLSQKISFIQHYELLNDLATQALEKWKKPIWVYYQVQSETKNQAEHCSLINLRRLQQSLEQAREEKDHRSIVLIDEFINQYKLAHPGKVTQFFQKLFAESGQQSSDYPMEQLFGDLSDEILLQLNEPVEILSKQTSLEQLAQEVNPDSDDLLLAMMQEPDLFNGLIVVKAAEQLDIDIDVNFDKVLEYFNVIINTPSDSL